MLHIRSLPNSIRIVPLTPQVLASSCARSALGTVSTAAAVTTVSFGRVRLYAVCLCSGDRARSRGGMVVSVVWLLLLILPLLLLS